MKHIFTLLLFLSILTLACCNGDGCSPKPDSDPQEPTVQDQLKELLPKVNMSKVVRRNDIESDDRTEPPNIDTLGKHTVLFPTGTVKGDDNNKPQIMYAQPSGVSTITLTSFIIKDDQNNEVKNCGTSWSWDGTNNNNEVVASNQIYMYEFVLDYLSNGVPATYTQSGDFLYAECFDPVIDELSFASEINTSTIPIAATNPMGETTNCP
ncbi:MAG: hypothetical protein KDC92_06600 [Bacteroidetes bacterium]|nr:hypothetical protein [Bacteroidota bacterium]